MPADREHHPAAALIREILAHPLYGELHDEPALRAFMRSHVFCVWDFQSLLKALQRELSCVDVPWRPTADPEARRFINELVLDEESDALPDGTHLSHFELYRLAMTAAGADTGPIDRFTAALARGLGLDEALDAASVPAGAAAFVRTTLRLALSGEPHRVAAALAWSREEVIPDMFRQLVASLSRREPARWETLRFYLERHIERDGSTHGPMAHAIVERLCGDDATLRREAEAAACETLLARRRLWDEIRATLGQRTSAVPAATAATA